MDAAGYVEDIYPPRLLYCRTIRSPAAKGRLVSVNCPPLPNNYTLISAADIPGKNQLEDTGLPILAKDELSYIGEPVALLLGPEAAKIDEYMRHCKVVAEQEPPVFFDSVPSSGMILAERNISIGNPQAAFEQAKTTVSENYRTGIQEHWYAEPVGAVVCFEETGEAKKPLVVYTATQWPHHVKLSVAKTLALNPGLVKVESTIIGLHMDGKLWYPSLIACHAALGAWITQKPVRLVLTKEEDFRYSPKRNAARISIKSALDDKGGILGAEIDVSVDLGAHELNTAEILDQTCLGSLSIYRGENVKLSARALKTNIPPQGPFSGFGLAQGFFAAERHASYIADLCGQNPAEWRKDNCLENWTLGMRLKESPPIHQLMDMAASMSGYYRKWASYALIMQSRRQNGWDEEKGENYRGIGIALGCQGSGLLYSGQEKGNYGIELTLEKDGSLEIGALVNSSSNDFIQIWAGIAAEILGIDPARVRINNKKDILNSGPSTASINITVLTKLVERSCLDIRKQRFRDPLPITVRRSYRPQKNLQGILPPPGRKILDASGFNNPSWAAAVVEVEIDQLEYIPRIRGAWMGIDCGKILDEEKARRSLRIQAIQALGWAYREQVTYSYGGISRDQFDAYDIPEPSDIPPINVDFMWNDSGEARGLGELPFSCLPAAFLQAASQAMDHHFQSIPLSSRDLWEAVKQKQEGNA